MIRSAYALGGLGSGLCDNEEKLRDMATRVSKVLRRGQPQFVPILSTLAILLRITFKIACLLLPSSLPCFCFSCNQIPRSFARAVIFMVHVIRGTELCRRRLILEHILTVFKLAPKE